MTTVTPSTGINVTPPSTSSSSTNGVPDFTSNFNTFLTLLTTQLQNQDPLSPLDSNQFVQQLVSFSEVEQQINTNDNLKQLIQLQDTNQAIAATPLVGQTIEFSSPTTTLENGSASFAYTLPSNTAATNLLVEDAQGNVVYSTSGSTSAGQHDFAWNGQTPTGLQMPDGGQYTLQVVAADASNNPVNATVTSFGKVDGVTIANNQTTVDISGLSVPLSELVAINPAITPNN